MLRLRRLGVGRPRNLAARARSLVDRLEQLAAACPEQVFLRSGARSLTFGEWNGQANRIAHWALRRRLGTGDTVAFYRAAPPELLAAWAGLAKVGVRSAFLPDGLHGVALESALELARARYLICGSQELAETQLVSPTRAAWIEIGCWREGARTWSEPELPAGVRDFGRELSGMPNADLERRGPHALRSDAPATLLWSVTETGDFRALRVPERGLLAEAQRLATAAGYGPDDVLYGALPLWHPAGLISLVGSALVAGASVVLPRNPLPARVLDDCRSFEVTSLHYSEEFARLLLFESPRESDREHSLRTLVGSGLRADLWERLAKRFGIARILELHRTEDGRVALWNLEGRAGAVGRLPLRRFSGIALVCIDPESGEPVRDSEGRCVECGIGEPGELVCEIEDAGVATSYLAEDIEEATLARSVRQADDRWRRSGDLVRRDRDGFCVFLGRVSERFEWRGTEVLPEELAAALRNFEPVQMASVYGVEVPGESGRAVMAAMVLTESAHFDPDAFYEFAERSLPAAQLPAFVRIEAEPDLDPLFRARVRSRIEAGWDPEQSQAPVFVRTEEHRSYERMTPMICALIRNGRRTI